MNLLPFFGRYSHFKFGLFSKRSVFLKFLNCHIILAQTTYFENIQYCKIYFHQCLSLAKTSYNDLLPFFGRYSHLKFRFFHKMSFFLKFSNCRIIIDQTAYFENINIVKYIFTMLKVWLKLVTMMLSPFLEDIPISNSDFFKKM